MQHTSMYNWGYRYYVYGGPGDIKYYRTLREAQEYVDNYGGRIGEVI